MTKRQLIQFHIGFWFFTFFHHDLLRFIGDKGYHFSLERFTHPIYLSSYAFQIVGTYGVLWILNRFFDKKAYLKAFLGIIGVILTYIFFRYILEEVLYDWFFHLHNYERGGNFTLLYYATDSAFNGMPFIFNAAIFKVVNDFFKNEKIKMDLKTEKTTAELAFLKSQLSPHFLFNILNNIYVLTYQKSDNAPAAMLKLSEIMRYMLYESNETTVDLEREVTYLQNLIELQKMRYNDAVYIETTFQGSFAGKQIAPLLLVPFVENAFKHGEVNDSNNPLIINLLESNNNLHFSVKNKKNRQQKDEVGGVGMDNVQRRLDLLYPQKYSLDIQENDTFYECELNVIL